MNVKTTYRLLFVKPGDKHQVADYMNKDQSQAFEIIRDKIGMGWILVEIHVEGGL